MFGLFKKKEKKYIDIDVAKFKELSASHNSIILDVRNESEVTAEAIPNHIRINVSSNSFKNKIQSLDKSKVFLVYCRSGMRSAKACNIMAELGFNDLYNLNGGIMAWKASN